MASKGTTTIDHQDIYLYIYFFFRQGGREDPPLYPEYDDARPP